MKVSKHESVEFGKMAYLAKMAELANNRLIVNEVSNKMAKGPF